MEQSQSIAKLTGAIIKAQGELKIVEKEAVNPFFKSKYADLPAIVKEYQRVFLKHGLAAVQIIEGKGLRTTLAHESGEFMSGVAEITPVKNDPQSFGSAITYMRRYALAAICGIVTSEDDDDGNAGANSDKDGTTKQPDKTMHESAKLAPYDRKITGVITTHEPDGAGLFHKFKLGDIVLTTSTKFPKILEDMKLYYDGGDSIEVIYKVSPSKNPKYPDTCYIQAVKPLGDAVDQF